MNKNMVILFLLVVLAAGGYYCYEHGCFNTEVAQVEAEAAEVKNVLHETMQPVEEDDLVVEEDFAA